MGLGVFGLIDDGDVGLIGNGGVGLIRFFWVSGVGLDRQ